MILCCNGYLYCTIPEIKFCTGLKPVYSLSKVIKILRKWSQMEISFSPFKESTKTTRRHHHYHHLKVFSTRNSESFMQHR